MLSTLKCAARERWSFIASHIAKTGNFGKCGAQVLDLGPQPHMLLAGGGAVFAQSQFEGL